jgi:hypothetical protein
LNRRRKTRTLAAARRLRAWTAALVPCVLLAACGRGGGDAPPPAERSYSVSLVAIDAVGKGGEDPVEVEGLPAQGGTLTSR